MSDRTNVSYVYDGSFDGLMCCVYESFYAHERPQAVKTAEEGQLCIFDCRMIETEKDKAERVKRAIREKVSKNALHFVKKAFLTCLEDKELRIIDFLHDCFKRGWRAMNDISGQLMLPLYNAVRALDNETELLKGFVRFSELGGVLVSVIEPKNYVLPMLMGHFCSRYHDQAIIIYDKTHRMILAGQNGHGKIGFIDEFEPGEPGDEELETRLMWKHFYDTIAIKERYNPRCRMSHMPKRYWSHMTEFWEQKGGKKPGTLYRLE